jgi:hypothetical protein
MVRQKINKIAIYRLRYVLAYLTFAVALAVMLLIAGFYLPGGLAASEIRSALISDHLNPSQLFNLSPEELIYLPYRLLQAATISIFGISILGIKLPSIILGFISALGILYLLNLWYHRNVAIIVAIIAVTTNQFLLASQAGQSGIVYIFLTTTILIAASMIARRSAYAKAWLLAGFVLAGISLYMPLNIYMLLALAITALFHPHARYLVVRKASKPIVLFGVVVFLAIISPLTLGIINDPSVIRTLLGISPESIANVPDSAATLYRNYTQFAQPTTSAVIAPVYGLGVVALIVVGLYRLFSAKYTARSYILSIWLLLLVPLVCLNPAFVSITFVPVVLLLALAVDYLIGSWYKLFPRNPYARIFGLLPLGVLVVGLVVSNFDRYVYGLHYDRSVYSTYSYDLPILSKKLRTLDKDSTVQLIVTKENQEFYKSFSVHQDYVKEIIVTTDTNISERATVTIAERSIKESIDSLPSEILVTRTTNDADRFYLYKKS